MTLGVVAAGAARFGIALGPAQLGLMARYIELLLARNQQLNLTRIVDLDEIERRHLLDSLTCALPVRDVLVSASADGGAGRTVHAIDVGSGGGLPGIPLAIAFPGLQMTLLESAGKKAAFLREVVAELGLAGVSVRTGRAEDVARDPDDCDAYHLVVARALAPLPVALEWCLPFARLGGVVVLPRGSDLEAQLADGKAAAAQLGGSLRPPVLLDDPDLPPGRSLAVADKLERTPERFPRRAGVAAKRPLTRT